jgi:hypothetical protein
MLLRLYEARSLVRNAFASMGKVLNPNSADDIKPAMVGSFVSISFLL